MDVSKWFGKIPCLRFKKNDKRRREYTPEIRNIAVIRRTK